MEKLLITGIAGGQGRLVARLASPTWDVCGVDRDAMLAFDDGSRVRVYAVDLLKRKFEDVFRHERPKAVIHLAFVRHFRASLEQRHEVNVLGTKHLLDYCASYGVRQLTVLSSAYGYGALADNPSYMDEDAPLNVSRNYPEVRDLAEVDALCSAFLWQHPEVRTTILRPVNTLGDSVHSAIGRYLRLRYVPMLMGFDPMLQFIHEQDLATRPAAQHRAPAARRVQRGRARCGAAARRDPRDRRSTTDATRDAHAPDRAAALSPRPLSVSPGRD